VEGKLISVLVGCSVLMAEGIGICILVVITLLCFCGSLLAVADCAYFVYSSVFKSEGIAISVFVGSSILTTEGIGICVSAVRTLVFLVGCSILTAEGVGICV